MKYTQPHRQYNVSVLTDSPYTDQLPPDAITQMYYDYRRTDSWKCVKPSNFVYPKARTLIKEYQKEYKEKWADIDTLDD